MTVEKKIYALIKKNYGTNTRVEVIVEHESIEIKTRNEGVVTINGDCNEPKTSGYFHFMSMKRIK